MKLLLLLISFNCFADFKLEIIPNDSKYGQLQITAKDQNELDEKINKFIDNSKFFIGKWGKIKAKSILERDYLHANGSTIKQYFIPDNYTVNKIDTTKEVQDAKDKKDKAKKDIDAIRIKLKGNSPMSLKEITDWIRIREGM